MQERVPKKGIKAKYSLRLEEFHEKKKFQFVFWNCSKKCFRESLRGSKVVKNLKYFRKVWKITYFSEGVGA